MSEKFPKPPTRDLSTEYLTSYEAKHIKRLEPNWEKETVIDIGPGKNTLGYQLAQELGAKEYIGLEPHHGEELKRGLDSLPRIEIPKEVVFEDALVYLEKLADHSCSFLISGIDASIMSHQERAKLIEFLAIKLSSHGSIILNGCEFGNLQKYFKVKNILDEESPEDEVSLGQYRLTLRE